MRSVETTNQEAGWHGLDVPHPSLEKMVKILVLYIVIEFYIKCTVVDPYGSLGQGIGVVLYQCPYGFM